MGLSTADTVLILTELTLTVVLVLTAVYAGKISRKLNRQSLLFQNVMESTPMGLVLYDDNEDFVMANEIAHDMIPGFHRRGEMARFEGLVNMIFRHRKHVEAEHSSNFRAAQPPELFLHDYREIIEYKDRVFLFQSRDMHAGIVVCINDLTAFYRRQQDIIRLNRKNHELIEAIEANENGIVIANPKEPCCPILFSNKAFFSVWDRPGKMPVGACLIEFIQRQGSGIDAGQIENRLRNGEQIRVDWKTGEQDGERWYELDVMPVRDKDGRLDLVTAIVSDVTAFKRREFQAYQAQKLESLGQLAGGIAHDFNNVLSIIDGYARMAQKHAADNETLTGYLERVRMATERASHLTRQLLTFGRHKIVGKQPVDVAETIRAQIPMLDPLLDNMVTLSCDLQDNACVECEPDGLSQVIMNLVINARDAMPEGGTIMIDTYVCGAEEIPVYLRKDEDLSGNYLRISVLDTGSGMDAETMNRMFDPFYTTKEQGKGTGLGLSMVHGIVNDMGGLIDVYSRQDEGTVFHIFLPVSDKEPQRKAISCEKEDGTVRLEGYTALVVEDEESLLEVLCNMLEDLGMDVLRGKNGADALVVQEEHEGDIDLLLTDVVMPELNGVRLAELMAEVRPDTRTIFVSGYPANGPMARVELPETAPLLAKPVDFEKLSALIVTVLSKEQAAGSGMGYWKSSAN